MKRINLILIAFIAVNIFGLFYADLTLASPPSGHYHTHNGRDCYVSIMGFHKPVIYDKTFLDRLIKHDRKIIKDAQYIITRADREELKTVAQDVINTHTQEKERLELLRKEWYNE